MIFVIVLSILIPIYNTDVTKLVKNLHDQCLAAGIEFEILGLEDGSSTAYMERNDIITNLSKVQIKKSPQNSGRVSTRQTLAKMAHHQWLLFLDADVMPISDQFMNHYIAHLDTNAEAVFGGFAYAEKEPSADQLLRWQYGRSQELKSAKQRNKNRYKIIISGNMLIRKNVFIKLNSSMFDGGYGMDNYFASLLKKFQIEVIHIDNNVLHLGLETSETYLTKVETSVETLWSMRMNDPSLIHDNHLLSIFEKVDSTRLSIPISKLYIRLKPKLKKHLLGPNPSIKLLQFYKLGHLCYLSNKTK